MLVGHWHPNLGIMKSWNHAHLFVMYVAVFFWLVAHFWSTIEQRARVQFLRESFVSLILSIVGLPSLYQREVWVSKFSKKGEGIRIFPLKRDGLVKNRGVAFKQKGTRWGRWGEGRGVLLNFILTKYFRCYFSLSVWCVCVCAFTLFLQYYTVLYLFHRKNLALKHLINRYNRKKRHSGK